jgi:hypothetical protein
LLEDAAKRASQWRSGDAPIRVERVIVGGGLAATLAWATRSRTEGTCVVLARGEEPWWSRREHRLGQPASELVSEGFVLQPHQLGDDEDGFAPARLLADAIAITAHEHGMPLVLGCCVDRPIEILGDGRLAVHAGSSRIEAEAVDVAVGPGPPLRLSKTCMTEEDERALLADGRMIFFGQDEEAAEASASLIGELRSRMRWIEHDGGTTRVGRPNRPPTGRIVGVCDDNDPPRLRCLGALLNKPVWKDIFRRSGNRRSNAITGIEAKLKQQAEAAPEHSRGVEGTVFQVSADVSLANGVPIDPGLGHERHALILTTWTK